VFEDAASWRLVKSSTLMEALQQHNLQVITRNGRLTRLGRFACHCCCAHWPSGIPLFFGGRCGSLIAVRAGV